MSPVKPQDVEPLIINESDDWCDIFKKLMESMYLFWKLVRYMFDSDGNLSTTSTTAQWGTDICSHTDCVEEE